MWLSEVARRRRRPNRTGSDPVSMQGCTSFWQAEPSGHLYESFKVLLIHVCQPWSITFSSFQQTSRALADRAESSSVWAPLSSNKNPEADMAGNQRVLKVVCARSLNLCNDVKDPGLRVGGGCNLHLSPDLLRKTSMCSSLFHFNFKAKADILAYSKSFEAHHPRSAKLRVSACTPIKQRSLFKGVGSISVWDLGPLKIRMYGKIRKPEKRSEVSTAGVKDGCKFTESNKISTLRSIHPLREGGGRYPIPVNVTGTFDLRSWPDLFGGPVVASVKSADRLLLFVTWRKVKGEKLLEEPLWNKHPSFWVWSFYKLEFSLRKDHLLA